MTRRSALVDEYLQRLNIDVSAPLAPTLATLSAVQRAQTLHVPFENVGMHEQPRIVDATQLHAFGMNAESSLTFPTPLFEKIVRERRGGVCFEQNVLLAWLLDALGFRVEILKAHVNRSLRGAPPTFNMIAPTHVCLRVRIDNCDDAYYVDCGLGPSSLTPLRFDLHGVEQIESPSPDPRRFWRIDNDANAQSITMCGDAGPWITVSYREPTAAEPYFRLWISSRPWLSIDEINGALDFIYQSPISWFVLTVIVIRSTERETLVLQNGKLVITDVRTGESTTQENVNPHDCVLDSKIAGTSDMSRNVDGSLSGNH